MVIFDDTRFYENITAATQTDLTGVPTRGGILLAVEARWVPYTFLNAGTVDEIAQGGNVEFIIGGTNGQSITSANPLQWNVVPQGDIWRWEHPMKEEITACSSVIEKLSPGTLSPALLGLIADGESIRHLYRPDPVRPLGIHSLEVHMTVLAFDLLAV